MLVRVNEASERPIYAQIADSVRADIASGRIGPGTVLPPAREVATGLGINVHTVLRAYQQLRDEGLVDLKRRRGAVVTQRATGFGELRDEARALVRRASELGVGPDALASLIMGDAAASASEERFEQVRKRAATGTAPGDAGSLAGGAAA